MANPTQTVFILGAGASKECGAPLMGEFLDAAHDLMLLGQTNGADEDFQRVFKWVAALKQTHSMSNLDIQNIESVFSALEMSKILNCFSRINASDKSNSEIDEYEKTVASLRKVIAITLENKTAVKSTNQPNVLYPSYAEFSDLIEDLTKKVTPHHVITIISFNYDLTLDYTLIYRGKDKNKIPYEYCLEEKKENLLPLLKLHGSLNWFYCKKCENILTSIPRPETIIDEYGKYITKINAQAICQKCRNTLPNEPIIVPPTWNKNSHYDKISHVWSHSAEKLSMAENIFVIGFSLPETDAFFKYLYGLGTVGSSHFKRFWVFNPDETVKQKFQSILGPLADKRFRFFPTRFSKVTSEILINFKRN